MSDHAQSSFHAGSEASGSGDRERMMQMITGYWITQIVHAAATYSLADHLAKGPATVEEIAKAEGTDASATLRLLRACASLGLLTYDGESRFAATPLLETLRKDNPRSLRGLALSHAAPGHWLPWGRFTDAVKTGQKQTVLTLGAEIFDYYAKTPAEAQAFTEAMGGFTASVAQEAARLINIGSITVAVDIGGANGILLHALLGANPNLKGIVFDLPHNVPLATAAAEQAGLQQRISAVGGDFFESVPAADLYLLKSILHDWDDAACIHILQNCRRASHAGGRIAVFEMLLGETGEPGLAPLVDMNMMVMTSGRERNLKEYQQLFEISGWRLKVTMPTRTPMTILEAVAI